MNGTIQIKALYITLCNLKKSNENHNWIPVDSIHHFCFNNLRKKSGLLFKIGNQFCYLHNVTKSKEHSWFWTMTGNVIEDSQIILVSIQSPLTRQQITCLSCDTSCKFMWPAYMTTFDRAKSDESRNPQAKLPFPISLPKKSWLCGASEGISNDKEL